MRNMMLASALLALSSCATFEQLPIENIIQTTEVVCRKLLAEEPLRQDWYANTCRLILWMETTGE